MTSIFCWSLYISTYHYQQRKVMNNRAIKKITDIERTYHNEIRIVQFGEGNFLRAFWGKAIHEMNASGVYKGQIAVIQPIKEGKIDLLKKQNYLYNVALQDEERNDIVLVESIREAINPYTDYASFLALATLPHLQVIISNTTEAGIVLDEHDSPFSEPPSTFPGKILAFLYERYKSFNGDESKGLLIIPCELIERNGERLLDVVVTLAQLNKMDKSFINWITIANSFYNTLVDGIVTGFPHKEIDSFTSRLGYKDELLVKSEPYRFLAIQGNKEKAKKFPIEKSSIKVVWGDDIQRFRDIKVRLLNGFQTMLSHYGFYADILTEREAVEDDIVGKNMTKGLYESIIPTLAYPEDEKAEFAATMLKRLKNPGIEHILMDINLNSFTKFQTRLQPSLEEHKKKGAIPPFLLFALALVLSYYTISEKDSSNRYIGVFKGKKYQVFDDPKLLQTLYTIALEATQKKWTTYEYLSSVMSSEKLWMRNLTLTSDEMNQVSQMIDSIKAGGVRAVDLF
ncbi:MAG: tagaturonate reductase [Spirochaetia bacterium]|nr:tagaturonate reductase [Spirochaetia bacterium]